MEFAEQLFSMLDETTRENLSYKAPKNLKGRLVTDLTPTGGNDGKDFQEKSDIEFIVGGDRVSFHGQRFVFGLLSSWFRERLYGPEKPSQLELPDVPPAVFRCIFNCAYGLSPDLSMDNVMNVLEAAQRMDVDVLMGECLGMLAKSINGDNVLTIFNAAITQNILTPAFEQQCCAIILSQSKAAMDSDAFLTLDAKLMAKLVECDFFFVQEINLWERLILWAKSKNAAALEERGECNDDIYQVGDKVTLVNGKVGSVAFKGEVDFANGIHYGIDFREGNGDTSGTVDGKQYFEASAENGGAFVRATRIHRKCEEFELPEDWRPMCKCGGTVEPMPAQDAYGGTVPNCDLCGAVISFDDDNPATVFHCQRGRVEEHMGGFDMCENCANGKKEKAARKGETVLFSPDDAVYLRDVLPFVRFPNMPQAYFITDVAPLLPSLMVESVLMNKIVKERGCMFPTHARKNWSSSAGEQVEYTVIAASSEMDKAKNIPDPNTQAEWSRESMASNGGRQWFICDCETPTKMLKCDMKNYYGDADTIKVIEVFAFDPAHEYSEEENEGQHWMKQCDINSEKTSSWQNNLMLPTEVEARYWKFVVTEVHGGESNYCCLDHLKLYGERGAGAVEIDLKPREMETRYTVIAASHSLERAEKLPERGQDAEWSRVKMEDAGGPQWFVADLGSPSCVLKLEMKHRYSDNDTIKDLHLYYLPNQCEFTTEERVVEGGHWVKACEVESAQSTESQFLKCDIDTDISARYWKFQVMSLYGGGPTCGNYPCMNEMIISCLQPVWTTGLVEVLAELVGLQPSQPVAVAVVAEEEAENSSDDSD